MTRIKKRHKKQSIYPHVIITVVLLSICIYLSYFILTTDIFNPVVSEKTTSYISFNNANTTDMIKISSLEKMTEQKAMTKSNKSYAKFSVDGKKNQEYKIVVYHLGNTIDDNNVMFYLTKNSKSYPPRKLSKMEETNDDGRVIYEGKIEDEDNFEIRMWISKSYDKTPKNISYEVRIKG